MHHADLQETQSAASCQGGVRHYAHMLYAALAIVKLTTLIQPATAGNQSNQHGIVTDLCWSLLAQQLPNQRMSPQNPVSLSDAEHAREGQVTPAMVDVLIPVMQQAVRTAIPNFLEHVTLSSHLCPLPSQL